MPEGEATVPDVPTARNVFKKRTRLSPVWIVPIAAALVGVWVAAAKILSEGPTITITFRTAEGLDEGLNEGIILRPPHARVTPAEVVRVPQALRVVRPHVEHDGKGPRGVDGSPWVAWPVRPEPSP